jgi:hypothetical protein
MKYCIIKIHPVETEVFHADRLVLKIVVIVVISVVVIVVVVVTVVTVVVQSTISNAALSGTVG